MSGHRCSSCRTLSDGKHNNNARIVMLVIVMLLIEMLMLLMDIIA